MQCEPIWKIQYRDGQSRAVAVRCKRWECESCKPRRQRQLRAYAMAGQPNTFLTLTSNPHHLQSKAERARLIVDAWRKLARLIKRVYRYDKLPYMVFIEETKRGEPHLHVLLRAKFIPQSWLATQWEKLTGAKIVDIRRITEQRGAARYVTKYTAKAPKQFRRMKRYFATQSYRLEKWKRPVDEFWQGLPWRSWEGNLAQLIWAMTGNGHQIVESDGNILLATGPPDGAFPPWAAMPE